MSRAVGATAEGREDWQAARLLPTVGLRGQEEQEQRATSSLLAVIFAVPSFGHALLADLGAPRGRIETFTEIQLRDAAGLFHLSWWRILTEAIVQHRHRGLSDPDQAWLLGQLIAYLDHHKSGASGFHGMGEAWVTVRTAAANETLRPRDVGAREVAEHWEQFIDYVALGLGQDLGRDVAPVRPRRLSSEGRLDETVRRLAETGKLQAALKVPDAIGNLEIEADLRTRKVTTSVEVAAPRDGRPKTRINWLLRQLRQAPPDLRIDVSFVNARETSSLLLSEANESPERLLSSSDPKRDPRTFRIALTRKMGTKRGKDAGSFVRETRTQAIDFYRDLVQDLRKWQPAAPKLPRDQPEEVPAIATPEPPLFSGTTSREPGAGSDPPS